MTLEEATRELGCKCTDIVTGFEGLAKVVATTTSTWSDIHV